MNSCMREKFILVPEIDLEQGLRFCVGNETNYKRALYAAVKSIRMKLPLMNSMLTTKEYDGLGVFVHTLIKLLSNIGATKLSDLSYEIEIATINENYSILDAKLEDYVEQLTDFLFRLEDLIRSIDTKGECKEEKRTDSAFSYDFSKTIELLKMG